MVFSEWLAHGVGHGGLCAVGDDFERVDEVLASVRELHELVFFGQFLDFDMLAVFFAFGFELIDSGGFFFDFCTKGFGFHHVTFHWPGSETFSEGEIAELDLSAGELGGSFANFPVEFAPCWVYDLCGLINGFELVVYKSVQAKVFPRVFEEVFLIPSTELRPGDCRRGCGPFGADDGDLPTAFGPLANLT